MLAVTALFRRDRRYPADVIWYDIEVSPPRDSDEESEIETYIEQLKAMWGVSISELYEEAEKRVGEIESELTERGYEVRTAVHEPDNYFHSSKN